MSLAPALLVLSVYVLVWEMLPYWGTWFNQTLRRLPNPLQNLYEQWRCAYCVGFWLALAMHGATGLWTLPALKSLPDFWGSAAPLIGWFLDALATATLVYLGKNLIDAIKLPAMKGLMMKSEFLRTWEAGKDEVDDRSKQS